VPTIFSHAIAATAAGQWWPRHPNRVQLFLWFAPVTASHCLLDAMTNGGRGIALFAPFSNHRYFFPWRPIQVSPIGAGFFSARGLSVLVSEARWIWVPSAIIAVSARIFRNGHT
jgi:inner membrane protein